MCGASCRVGIRSRGSPTITPEWLEPTPAGESAGVLCVAATPCIDKLAEIERFEYGTIHRLTGVTAVPGGKGLNVARAARLLGARVSVIAILAGHAGRWIAEGLAAREIPGRFVWSPGETRSCLSVADRKGQGLTEFYEPATPIRGEDWQTFIDLLAAGLEEGPGLVTVSGSLPAGAPADGYAQICALAERSGVRLILDSHGASLERALPARPWLVKVNAKEAAGVVPAAEGTTQDGVALAAALRHRGAANAIVTLGRQGLAISSPTGQWRIGSPSQEGRYPVGSGDALLAGLAVRLLAGDGLEEAARLGTAAAIANALRPGAGVLDPADVYRLLPGIQLERLS